LICLVSGWVPNEDFLGINHLNNVINFCEFELGNLQGATAGADISEEGVGFDLFG